MKQILIPQLPDPLPTKTIKRRWECEIADGHNWASGFGSVWACGLEYSTRYCLSCKKRQYRLITSTWHDEGPDVEWQDSVEEE